MFGACLYIRTFIFYTFWRDSSTLAVSVGRSHGMIFWWIYFHTSQGVWRKHAVGPLLSWCWHSCFYYARHSHAQKSPGSPWTVLFSKGMCRFSWMEASPTLIHIHPEIYCACLERTTVFPRRVRSAQRVENALILVWQRDRARDTWSARCF